VNIREKGEAEKERRIARNYGEDDKR